MRGSGLSAASPEARRQRVRERLLSGVDAPRRYGLEVDLESVPGLVQEYGLSFGPAAE
jgi:hypothetical protein